MDYTLASPLSLCSVFASAHRELEVRSQAGDSVAQHFFKIFKPFLEDLAHCSSGRKKLSMRKSHPGN